MIEINHLKKTVGIKTLFEIDHLSIGEEEKVGLIGNNGVGKTTFLRVLLGIDKDFQGSVRLNLKVKSLLKETREEIEVDRESYSKAHLNKGERRSPGEDQRLKLEQVLKDPQTFLLLDEPSAHLDIHQREDLMKNLKSRKGGFILISHDREVLNETCTKVIEIINGKFEVYSGNYEFYLEEKARRRTTAEREYENFISEKRRLEGLKTQIRAQSDRVRRTPKRMGNSEARLHKMGGQENKKKLDRQVKAVESQINQLQVKEKPEEERKIELTIPEGDKIHSKILVRGENLWKGFGDKLLFERANFAIENNTKVAILGNNGVGKTTLLKMILRKEDLWVHPKLSIGYYSQMEEILDSHRTILENILESSIYDETMTRIILARLGFREDAVFKEAKVLSDGERAKVKLGKLLTSNFNLLILDEPTNHLDLHAIEALEELLAGYDRALIFVTHDISLINHIANRLLMIEDHRIESFTGNYSDYRKRQAEKTEDQTTDDLLIDYRLASINSRLTQEISKEERKALEVEYQKLLEQKKNH